MVSNETALSYRLMILQVLGDVGPVARLEAFGALKLSRLESFRALKSIGQIGGV